MQKQESDQILAGLSLLSALKKYNSTLASKMIKEKQKADSSRSNWKELENSLNIKPDGTVDVSIRKQVYLKMMDHLQTLLDSKNMILKIKEQVNNNEGKLKVVRMLVRDSDDDLLEKIEKIQEEGQQLQKEVEKVKYLNSDIRREIDRATQEVNGSKHLEQQIEDTKRKIAELNNLL